MIRDWHRRLGGRGEPPATPTSLEGNQALFSRGPLGLHALRVHVGDAAFFATLQAWTREHHRGAARLDAFLDTAERVTAVDLDDWWHAWLLDESVPGLADLGLEP